MIWINLHHKKSYSLEIDECPTKLTIYIDLIKKITVLQESTHLFSMKSVGKHETHVTFKSVMNVFFLLLHPVFVSWSY